MQNAPWWEAGFLKALAETGIVTQSAKAAGISARAAAKRRAANPTFAAAWQSALDLHRAEQARGALSAAGELVVDGHDGAKLVRAGQSRWSRRGEEAFLTELAVTANVRRAAAAAGFTPACVYGQRRRNRCFAEAWDHAVAIGRTRLEAYLVEIADRSFDPDSLAVGGDLPTMTVAEAIAVLKLAQGRAAGGGKPAAPRGWTGPDDWDEPREEGTAGIDRLREGILAKLDKIRAREAEEKLAKGWTRYGDDWVPPGYERRQSDRLGDGPSPPLVVEGKLVAVEASAEAEPQGPRVRRL